MSLKQHFDNLNKWLALPAVLTFFAICGFVYSEYKEIRKAENELIAKQLSEFYVPLRDSLHASSNEWNNFRKEYGANRTAYFNVIIGIEGADGKRYYLNKCDSRNVNRVTIPGKLIGSEIDPSSGKRKITYQFGVTKEGCQISDLELKGWVRQMSGTFKPFHQRWEDIILKNKYLVGEDKEVTEAIDELMLHITGYKSAFSKWEIGDFSQMTSYNNFPAKLEPLLNTRISQLSSRLDSQFPIIPRQVTSNTGTGCKETTTNIRINSLPTTPVMTAEIDCK